MASQKQSSQRIRGVDRDAITPRPVPGGKFPDTPSTLICEAESRAAKLFDLLTSPSGNYLLNHISLEITGKGSLSRYKICRTIYLNYIAMLTVERNLSGGVVGILIHGITQTEQHGLYSLLAKINDK